MEEHGTLVVIEIDTPSLEEQENARLREYAKQSGPAGVGMEPEEKVEESVMDIAKRYGQQALDYPGETWDELFGSSPSRKRSPSRLMEQAGMDPQSSDGGGFTIAMPPSGVGPGAQSELHGMVEPVEDVHLSLIHISEPTRPY